MHPDTADPTSPGQRGLPAHPVVRLLSERARAKSRPGARDDDARAVLVIEGGGMRGGYSAGMVGGLEERGLRDAFDAVYGASAGALNGAYFVAGQAVTGATMYHEDLMAREFINPWRGLLLGRVPVVRMEYAIDYLYREVKPLDVDAVIGSPIELHVVATDADTGAAVDFTGARSWEELRLSLLASTRVPVVAGPPVVIDGRRYIDATLSTSVPFRLAFEDGATHVMVLRSRRNDAPPINTSGPQRWVLERSLRRINAALLPTLRDRPRRYREEAQEMARLSAGGEGPPYLCTIEPGPDAPPIHQLSRDAELAERVVGAGREAVREAFAG